MKQGAPTSWLRYVFGAIVVVLVVAAGARVAYELLAPLIPWLLVTGLLAAIYILVFRPGH